MGGMGAHMPLPKPTLDNRSFDQLVAEGRGLIPRLARPWTDHNASDPGITLIELAAWLAEQNVYRLDRLPDEAVRRFARLVGVEPLAPQVADTVVSVGGAPASGIALPPRMQLHGAAGPLFETTQPVHVSPAKLIAIGCADKAGRVIDLTQADEALQAHFPLSARPRVMAGHAFYLGFDRALDTAGALLSLHVWTDRWLDDAATRQALITEQAALEARAERDCRCGDACAASDWRLHHRAWTVWEFYAGGGRWLPLQDVVDETRALTMSGFVRFAAPTNHLVGGLDALVAAHFIRCRLVGGGYECAPRLLHTAFNAVAAEHALSRDERQIGTASGHAGARFAFGEKPIVADSVALRLDDGLGAVQTNWVTRTDGDGSSAHDRHALLLPEDGELVSGNGLRGLALPAGFAIHASYRVGGGVSGNLGAGSLVSLPATPDNLSRAPAMGALGGALDVVQPFSARGGAPRETLDALRARAYANVSGIDKAVTLDDFVRLALATPGVPVARAHAVANMLPQLPCWSAPGVVTVVVVPRCRRPAPMPSRALLERVRAYLEPRRLVTTEVHVIPPRYRRVGVQALLHLDREEDAQAAFRLATEAVNRFFDALSGGPDGAGWPIGRTVYRNEVIALLAALPGVVRVTEFGWVTGLPSAGALGASESCGCQGTCGCGAATTSPTARCDNVELCAHELVRPGRHRFRARTPVPTDLNRSLPHECQHVR